VAKLQSTEGRVPSSVKPLPLNSPMQHGYSKAWIPIAWKNDGYRCENKRRIECSSAGPGDGESLSQWIYVDVQPKQCRSRLVGLCHALWINLCPIWLHDMHWKGIKDGIFLICRSRPSVAGGLEEAANEG